MPRSLAVAGLLADLDRTAPAAPVRPTRHASERFGSLEAASRVSALVSTPVGDAFVFLVDEANALEMRPGEFIPSTLWHFCATRRRWVSIPAPAVEALAPWFATLEAWIDPSAAEDRASEATRTAEAMLADQSGLRVIPAVQLPALIQVGRPLLTELLATLPPVEPGTDTDPTGA